MNYFSSDTNACDKSELLSLIEQLDHLFQPPLSDRVDIDTYVNKLHQKASLELAYTDNGRLAGMISYYKNDKITKKAYISLLGVLPEFHGQGIASVLIERCISRCEQAEMKLIKVRTEKNNTAAINLYKKKNFRIQEDDVTGDSWESIYLVKSI